jgi:hypothetical protein
LAPWLAIRANIALETSGLATSREVEFAKLTRYRQRGLDAKFAVAIAAQLTAHNPLAAHLRDEFHLEPTARALARGRP